MKPLAELIKETEGVLEVFGNPAVVVKDIFSKVQSVGEGDAFAGWEGQNYSGASLAEEAFRRGAVAAVLERRVEPPEGKAVVLVRDVRKALADMCFSLYGKPSLRVHTVGITGTDGKGTTGFFIYQALRKLNRKPAMIGTLGLIADTSKEIGLTTPEADVLARAIRELADSGHDTVILEASAHALDQERLRKTFFDIVCFTNLSHEHLDYFKTMDAYFSAKLKILNWIKPEGRAVASTSIRAGRIFLRHARKVSVNAPFPVGGYRDRISIAGVSFCPKRMLTEVAFRVWVSKKRFKLERVKIKALGRFNAENLLVAAGALLAMGYTPEEAKYALDMVSTPPGRMEVAKTPDGKILVIDYAHTPRALRRVLEELKTLFPGARVVAVFGAGGDRDRRKRPLMGQVAGEFADFSILTSDNPRSEDPKEICLEILSGFPDKSKAKIVIDREKAIVEALSASQPGDVILFAGKGHETYQIIGGKRIPFSEREIIENFYGRKVFEDVEI